MVDVPVQVGGLQGPDLREGGQIGEPGGAGVAGHLQGTLHDPQQGGLLITQLPGVEDLHVDLAGAQGAHDIRELLHCHDLVVRGTGHGVEAQGVGLVLGRQAPRDQ